VFEIVLRDPRIEGGADMPGLAVILGDGRIRAAARLSSQAFGRVL
jgi:hypothetical protein